MSSNKNKIKKVKKPAKDPYSDTVKELVSLLRKKDPAFIHALNDNKLPNGDAIFDQDKNQLDRFLLNSKKDARLRTQIKISKNAKKLLDESFKKLKNPQKFMDKVDVEDFIEYKFIRDIKKSKEDDKDVKKNVKMHKKINKFDPTFFKSRQKMIIIAEYEQHDPDGFVETEIQKVGLYEINEFTDVNKFFQTKKQEFINKWKKGNKDRTHYYTEFIKKLKSVKYEITDIKMKRRRQEFTLMNNQNVLRRDWLRYSKGIAEKSYKDLDNKCVYSLLIDFLKCKWTKVDENKLFELFKPHYKHTYKSLDLDDKDEFTLKSGVSTDMINKGLCLPKNIVMYAFNADDQCFYNNRKELIEIGKNPANSSWGPLVFYSIDNHFYLINDKHTLKSIGSSLKYVKNVFLKSSLLDGEKEKPEEKEYIELNNFDDALKLKNSNIILPEDNLEKYFIQYIKEKKEIPKVKIRDNEKIIKMELKDLTIMTRTNKNLSCEHVKKICEKASIPFSNQSIGALLSQIREKFYQPIRKGLNKEQKEKLSENGCNSCLIKFEKYEYDHINPLSCGGSNDFSNMQALCEGCHFNKTQLENEDYTYFIKQNPISSCFNKAGLNIINAHLSKHWALVDVVKKPDVNKNIWKIDDGKTESCSPESSTLWKIDHIKCRKNLLYYSNYNFPQFTVMDDVKPYKGDEIQCGYYYVECDDYVMGIRGNGWYNYVIIKKALEENIIEKEQIKYEYLSSFQIPKTLFQSLIDYIFDISKEVDEELKKNNKPLMSKLLINSLIGCFNIMHTHFETLKITKSKDEAANALCDDNTYVKNIQIDNDFTIYKIIKTNRMTCDDIYTPIYDQIIAMENVSMYELEKIILENDGDILERNTDSILFECEQKINIDDYFWDTDKSVNKYRYEKPTHLKCDSVMDIIRTETFVYEKPKYNIINEVEGDKLFDELSDNIIEMNAGITVQGYAGTGKTTLLKQILKKLEEKQKKVIKLAPTNKACLLFQGKTIHKFYIELMLSQNYEKKIINMLKTTDYIFVDEISMLGSEFYRLLCLIKMYLPNINIIMAGDFNQLCPVADRWQGNYKNCGALYDIVDGNKIMLTKCVRSDKELFDLSLKGLNNKESIYIDTYQSTQLTKLNLSFTHITRKRVNRKCNKYFSKGKEVLYFEGNDKIKTQKGCLYVGCPIISYKNNRKLNIFNNQTFEVVKINKYNDTFYIICDGVETEFKVKDFSSNFLLAYCITIHCSQGQTYDEPYTIHDWNHLYFNNNLAYVALSRATKAEYIKIDNDYNNWNH
jgi:hypothetical protein